MRRERIYRVMLMKCRVAQQTPDLASTKSACFRDAEEHGWFVMKVGEDQDSPAFAYSFGLYEEFRHPEIIIFGLNLSHMHRHINNVVDSGKARCSLTRMAPLQKTCL